MSNAIWAALVADFKSGVIDVETFVQKTEAWIATQLQGLPALIGQIISADAAQLVQDAEKDIQDIVTNIQNNTAGLSLAIFPALFKAAVLELPIIEQQGLQILENDWTLITAYYAANNNITPTPANNGNLTGGTQVGG